MLFALSMSQGQVHAYAAARRRHATRFPLHKNVAFLLVLRDVQTAHFFFWSNTDANDGVDELQNYERGNDAEHPRHADSNKLALERSAALEQSHRLVIVEVP